MIFLKAIRAVSLPLSFITGLFGGVQVFFVQSSFMQKYLFILCFLLCISLHIAVNTGNDYYDSKSGLDTSNSNPYNMIAQGVVSSKYMLNLYVVFFLFSIILGLYIVFLSSFFYGLFFGAVFLLIIHFYSANISFFGKKMLKPIGYFPLGEIISALCFGPLGVCLIHFVIFKNFSYSTVALGFIPGFLAFLMMYLNNKRDLKTDKKVGKITLAAYLNKK
ncbi:MAG: prenyltransferase [Bifidobacteriaceae bacterium]|jgi:1,4-dihydroxy-2-naphthoate octaprenyltransferase|nr:prenyltransferase [Bifidobacteriaceae bacterium]